MRQLSLLTLALTFTLTSGLRADPPSSVVARLGSDRLRHPERPHSLAFAPSGEWFVSGGSDGTIRAWDSATGKPIRSLHVPGGIVTAVGFSTDGKLLAAHFAEEKIRLLDAVSFKLIREIPSPNLESITLSADGSLLLGVGLTGNLLLVETANGLPRMELPDGKAGALLPDGSAILAADHAEKVTLYEIPSGKPLFAVGHPTETGVNAIAVSPDGKRFATANTGAGARVRIWDTTTGKPVTNWPGEAPIAFAGADRLAARNGGKVVVRKLDGTPIRELDAGASQFALSRDGSQLLTAAHGPRLRLWSLTTGAEVATGGDELGTLSDVAVNGRELIVASSSGIARWSPGEKPRIIAVPPVAAERVAVAGSRVLVPIADRIGIWDANSPAKSPARVVESLGGPVRAIAATPDGSRGVVATEAPNVVVFDPASGTTLAKWTAPTPALGIAISPDGRRVITVGRDGFVRGWNVADGENAPIWTTRLARSFRATVTFSPDGKSVAVSSIIRVTVFDATSGKKSAVFERGWEDGPFQAATFSPDGRFLAAGSQGNAGAVTVWELATNTVARRFTGDTGSVLALGFLDGGRQVASLAADDSVTVWDVTERRGSPAPTDTELATAWKKLDRVNAMEGFTPVWTLADGGDRSVTLIRTELNDAGATDRAIAKLVKVLDADVYQDREAAAKELRLYGVRAVPALTITAKSHPSPEARERAEVLIDRINKASGGVPENGLYGEPLRQVRAVAVLERIGTPEAVLVLAEMRKLAGFPGTEATLAWQRLHAK